MLDFLSNSARMAADHKQYNAAVGASLSKSDDMLAIGTTNGVTQDTPHGIPLQSLSNAILCRNKPVALSLMCLSSSV